MNARIHILAASIAAMTSFSAAAEESAEELAKKLANPIASLISVPFQYNYDYHFHDDHTGHRSYLNLQPVWPFSLNKEWNLISRTILPFISQNGVVPGGSEAGLGDTTQSLFFSPKAPTAAGWIWGAGPAFLLPTGTNAFLSQRKWGIGPTVVLLKQQGHWTYGVLSNQIWGTPGPQARPNVSNLFLQPFVAYTTKEGWSFTVNSESNYDWKTSTWSVPFNFQITKVMKFGKQHVSIGGGLRYWATTPDLGPNNWGARIIVTLLFPK